MASQKDVVFVGQSIEIVSEPLTRWWMKTPLLTERVVDHCKGWTCRVWVSQDLSSASYVVWRCLHLLTNPCIFCRNMTCGRYLRWMQMPDVILSSLDDASWALFCHHRFQIGSVYSWFGVPDLGGMSNMIWPGSITVHLRRYAQSFQDCPVSFLAAWVTPRIHVCVYNVLSTFRYINLSKL